ncbi:hypothetical protein AB0H57_02740 [Micromonospora sp. NPDC050686]|uniref:hypothetical protein n=1 Tax=Micromonospora sp. NPDC050686 TaxID=3154631 RepID=UPI00340A0FBF
MGMPDADGHGPTEGLPDLPPEWGRVVVPDDASALAEEATQVRRELLGRATARAGHPPDDPAEGRLPLRMPLLVLLVTVLTTLAGLAAVTWPRNPRGSARPTVVPQSAAADLTGRPLPALDLVDTDQRPLPLRGLVPAVIILVDGCACPERVAEAATAAPAGVAVVTVAAGRAVSPTPSGPGAGRTVRALADPAGGLRAFVRVPPRPDTVTALLVDQYGILVELVPQVGTVEDYRSELVRLAG